MSSGNFDWFSEQITYKGDGKAEFQDPSGYVEGVVEIVCDKYGNTTIAMDVESFNSEKDLHFGLMELLSKDKPFPNPNNAKELIFDGLPGTNKCLGLTVATSEGVFQTSGEVAYDPGLSIVGEGSQINFFRGLAEFTPNQPKTPTYWAIPLINFISRYQQVDKTLESHPLRLKTITSMAGKVIPRVAPLIVFENNNHKGFIEPLDNQKERQTQLLSGEVRSIVTSVMVGTLDDISVNSSNFREHIPFGLLPLLELASGNEIGVAWLELRDAEGNLVQRIHDGFPKQNFSKGRAAISEAIHGQTGLLLTQAQYSPFFGKSPLGPVIFDLVRSGLSHDTIEDKFSRISRGFDHLCEQHGLDTQNLARELSEDNRDSMKEILRQASASLRSIADGEEDSRQSQILQTIVSRMNNVANKDRNFGIAVLDLLNEFDLVDAQIVDNYYETHPRADSRKRWASVLSHYRGTTVHTGYFEGGSDMEDVIRIKNHLRDILLRIVLKMLGYTGTYQPTFMPLSTQKEINWVTLETSASDLWYGRRPGL